MLISYFQVDCLSVRSRPAINVVDQILKVAAAFVDKGLKKGDVVCFICPNSDYYALLLFGVIAAGGIFTACPDNCPFGKFHPLRCVV